MSTTSAEPVIGRAVRGPITADQLVTWPTPPGTTTVTIDTRELTALCPETGQPDFYQLQIRYRPGPRIVELKALKLYLWSFREQGIGVEQLAAAIGGALVTLLDPEALTVELHQETRGGLDTTARADHNGGVPCA